MEPTIPLPLDELPRGAVYDLLCAAIAPRPIALVGTLGEGGIPNIAPFSFFMPGGTNPPSLAFSPTLNMQGEPKDTLANLEASGAFTVSVPDRAMAAGMNQTAYGYPRGFDEWRVAGFTPVPARRVPGYVVAESPAAFECRLFQVVRHGDGPGSAAYVVGEVVGAWVRGDLWREPFEPARLQRAIGRLGGAGYVDLAGPEIFEMPRPTGPAESSG